MALRTVKPEKKKLHTRGETKVKVKSKVVKGASAKVVSPIENNDSDGRMAKSSRRIFLPEDNLESKPGEQKIVRGRALRKAVREGTNLAAENMEGGEELKDSAEVLEAIGAVGKIAFRSRREREMARDKTGIPTKAATRVGTGGASSGGTTKSSSESKGSSKLRTKDRETKTSEGLSSKKSGKGRKASKRKSGLGFDVRGRMKEALRQRHEDDSGEMVGGAQAVEGANTNIVRRVLLAPLKAIVTLLLPFILVVLLVVAVVGALVVGLMYLIYGSPFSIFFPLPDTGTDDPRTVLSGYYQEFNTRISDMEADGDVVTYTNNTDGAQISNYRDTLMVYMMLYSDGVAGYVMDDTGKANLKKVFDEMNYIEEGEAERQITVGDSLGKVDVTAYCPCEICSGPHGWSTASGKRARAKHTLAVDYRNPIVPIGTKVVIDGVAYTVEDTGDLEKNGISFDMFFETHDETEKWGRKKLEVFIASDKNTSDDESGDLGDDNGGESGVGDDEKITVTTQGAVVHNLTYEDYISSHPELNDTQKTVLTALMTEEASIYGGGSDIGQSVVQLGMTKLGCRYDQGRRMQEGYYDCSSFVYRLYKEFGVILPLTAAEQGKYCATKGLIINKEDLQPGDLIFYSYTSNGRYRNISHVAIYVGDGKMIHAANKRRGVVMDTLRTGSVVFYGRVV